MKLQQEERYMIDYQMRDEVRQDQDGHCPQFGVTSQQEIEISIINSKSTQRNDLEVESGRNIQVLLGNIKTLRISLCSQRAALVKLIFSYDRQFQQIIYLCYQKSRNFDKKKVPQLFYDSPIHITIIAQLKSQIIQEEMFCGSQEKQRKKFNDKYTKKMFRIVPQIYSKIKAIQLIIILYMDRDGRKRETRSHREKEVLAKTSIQHLYQLLGNNMKEAPQPSPLFTIQRKVQIQQPEQSIRINFDYSRGPTETSQSPSKGNILDGFHKKTRKFCSRKKKAFSVELSNTKLKDIIFGKSEEKKSSFFNSTQSQPHKNMTVQKTEPSSVPNKAKNRQAMERFEMDCEMRAQATVQLDLNNHFQNFKSALKLKPIEYYIKKTKNSKFSIMGLSVKRQNKMNSKECKQIKESPIEQLEISILNGGQGQDRNVSQWKIDSIPMKFSENKRHANTTNIQKIKKSSLQTLISKCLPNLMISEHILCKIEQMKKFYNIVLLSFHCLPLMLEPNQLPKYHRKHIKYTYFVGGGNNRTLVVELMEKRWWWKETSDVLQANFIWTQQKIKINKEVKFQEIQSTSNTVSQQKMDKNKIQSAKRQLFQAHQGQKCKNIFQSFEYHNKKVQNDEFIAITVPSIMYNHMPGGKYLGNKKSLFQMLKIWFEHFKKKPQQLFSFIPQTYYVENSSSQGFQAFKEIFEDPQKGRNLWIIKPGQNSNRGKGIFLSSSIQQITEAIQTRSTQGGTTIIQKYLSNLLFYHGRKFDIRAYLLCITIGGNTKYYWYQQGYLRTSSHPFSLKELSIMTHLTNDAIQSQGDQYGKFQKGNKLSYSQFQNYLQENSMNWKMSDLKAAMKRIAKIIATASHPIINYEKNTGFQLFGMDFIVDSSFKPWLLQVNTNPCLQLSCPLLQKLIPNIVQNVLRLSLDPIFSPNVLPNKQSQYTIPDKLTELNKFELIFDGRHEKDQQWQKILTKAWQSSKQTRDFNSIIQ